MLPGSGYRVTWDGLWADLVVGVSLENLVHGGTPRLAPGVLLDVLQRRLNSSQVGGAPRQRRACVMCCQAEMHG